MAYEVLKMERKIGADVVEQLWGYVIDWVPGH